MPVLTFLAWLALVGAAGWLAFPLSRRAFGDAVPDAGLALGRILLLALWGLLAFWLGQFGVPVALSAWIYALLAVASLLLWRRERRELAELWRARKRTIILSETIFVTVFLSFFLLRGFWSDASGTNGEKSMDSALIGSLARAQHLPPPNPYAAGARLDSYYYFGHLETALLTRASGTTVRWSYNLMCATLPALCAAALFGLGGALTGSNKGGLWVAGATLAGGTLQPLYQWTNPDPSAPARLFGLDAFLVSRVLPYSINEFPWFTFNQADLHGHYFDFPLEIALMTLAWSLYRAKRPRVALLAALILGAQILTNTWDFPAYALLIGLAIVSAAEVSAPEVRASQTPETATTETATTETAQSKRAASKSRAPEIEPRAPEIKRPMPERARVKAIRFGLRVALTLAVVAGALVVAAPFLVNLKSAATPPQALAQPASPLREWLLLWGPLALAWWTFAALRTFRDSPLWRAALGALGYAVLWCALLSRWQTPSPLVLPLIAACVGLGIAGAARGRGAERFLCLMGVCGLLAIAWSETTWAGFLGDPDKPQIIDSIRQDTVFKFGLQGWMLWGTASASAIWLALRAAAPGVRVTALVAALPLAATMLIGNLAFVAHRTRFVEMAARWHDAPDLANWPRARAALKFDGWDAWAHLAPPEKAAADWLQNHVRPGENIVEAEQQAGGDYSEYTRYAHATGIATIVGPMAHTFQWSPANAPLDDGQNVRGTQTRAQWAAKLRARKSGAEWAEVMRRKSDVRAIYSVPGQAARAALLARYGVKYLVWGELERREYGDAALVDLVNTLPLAAQFGAPDDPHRAWIFRIP